MRKTVLVRKRSDESAIIKPVCVKSPEPPVKNSELFKPMFTTTVCIMAGKALNREQTVCVEMLKKRAEELGRPPKKSDMEELWVRRIKRVFGPWTKALMKAGVVKPTIKWLEKQERKKQKFARRREKHRRVAMRQAKQTGKGNRLPETGGRWQGTVTHGIAGLGNNGNR